MAGWEVDAAQGSVAGARATMGERCVALPCRLQALAGGSTSAEGFVLRGVQLLLGMMSLELKAEMQAQEGDNWV